MPIQPSSAGQAGVRAAAGGSGAYEPLLGSGSRLGPAGGPRSGTAGESIGPVGRVRAVSGSCDGRGPRRAGGLRRPVVPWSVGGPIGGQVVAGDQLGEGAVDRLPVVLTRAEPWSRPS